MKKDITTDFVNQLKDKELKRAWSDNIAMAFKDDYSFYNSHQKPGKQFMSAEDLHIIANNAAESVLKIICKAMGKDSDLTKALKKDKSLRETWSSNIAMAYKDNWNWYKKETGKRFMNAEDRHIIANKSSEYFLKMVCK